MCILASSSLYFFNILNIVLRTAAGYRAGYSSIYNYNLYSNIIFVIKITCKRGIDVISKTSVKRC